MKVLLLGDLHFGARNNAQWVKNYQKQFIDEVLLPKCEEYDIENIIQLGDMFENRKSINIETFHFMRKEFLEKLNVPLHVLVGNHDTYYRNTNEINSLTEFFNNNSTNSYSNLYAYDDYQEIDLGSTRFALVPWINPENEQKILDSLAFSDANVVLGHFEISGFKMLQHGMRCEDGISQDTFNDFDYTFSGHFHHPSRKGNIIYIGSPFELFWGDEGDPKGFVIFDTETGEYEWFEIPLFVHKKIFYNDSTHSRDEILNNDYSYLQDKKVKIIVEEKNDEELFDEFIEKFSDLELLEFSIQEAVPGYSNGVIEDEGAEVDTLTVLKQNVSMTNDNKIDTRKLESMISELYSEALNYGIGE